jgi:hypothetical protein
MNITRSLFSPLLCVLVLSHSVTYTENSSLDNAVQVASAACLGILGVAGIAKLAEWYFTETNTNLIARAESEYTSALRFSDVVMTFERLYGISGNASWRQDEIIKNISESILYELALTVWHKNISQLSFIDSVATVTKNLENTLARLRTRINALQGNYLYQNELVELNGMKSAEMKINTLLPRLSLLLRYYQQHNRYFLLYDKEAEIYKVYDVQLRIARSGNHYNVIAYDICQSIQTYNDRFPFVAFVNRLSDHLSGLKRAINFIPVYYSDRFRLAQELEQTLEFIKKTVVSDPRYRAELNQIEQERFERMRIEEMQRANEMEERHLYAQRDRTRELNKQNRLLQEANNLKRQELFQENDRIDLMINIIN